MRVYQALARAVSAAQAQRPEFAEATRWRADEVVRNDLPSGGGWDCGTKLDWERSTPDKLVLVGSFHHMNETGMYDGWTDHEIWVRPSLSWDIEIDVKGRNRNDIKDYLGEMFDFALRQEVQDA